MAILSAFGIVIGDVVVPVVALYVDWYALRLRENNQTIDFFQDFSCFVTRLFPIHGVFRSATSDTLASSIR
jgi:hypothetical protein